jgi:hypothetical protein
VIRMGPLAGSFPHFLINKSILLKNKKIKQFTF